MADEEIFTAGGIPLLPPLFVRHCPSSGRSGGRRIVLFWPQLWCNSPGKTAQVSKFYCSSVIKDSTNFQVHLPESSVVAEVVVVVVEAKQY